MKEPVLPSLPGEITQLLIKWGSGDRDAFEELIPVVYEELKRLARRYMGKERLDHTLQTSALIMRLTSGSSTATPSNGRTAITSSPSRPRLCGTS